LKKHIKTSLIVLLGASALFLVWRLYDGDAFFRDFTDAEVYAPARLDYTRAAAVPAKCAVMRDGVRTGAQYDALAEAVYNAFKPYLSEAFGKADGGLFFVSEGNQLQDGLSDDGVYFEFSGPLPLGLVAAWLSAACPPELAGLEIIGLGLSGIDTFPDLPELRPCFFAFERVQPAANQDFPDYSAVFHPLQLLMEEPGRNRITVSSPPAISSDISYYSPFLENLFPADTSFYTRGESRVYVDGENGCEISSDGTILFYAPSARHDGRPVNTAEDVLRAWEALALLRPAMGDAVFEVHRARADGDSTIVEFLAAVEGVPLLWEPAVVEMSFGAVRRVSLKLCRVTLEGGASVPPMPLRQTAALLPPGDARMELRYGSGGVVEWVIKE
jgi:hypothetical protein